MPYCTAADVQEYFANITFGTSTPVTVADIENFHIPLADALIDASLRGLYAVPITHPSDLPLMRSISSRLAAQSVANVLFFQLAGDGGVTIPEEGALGVWGGSARKDLTAIQAGQVQLATARASGLEALGFERDAEMRWTDRW